MKTQPRKYQRTKGESCFWPVAVYFGLVVCGVCQPTILRNPTNQFVSIGATAQFQVSASGTAPLSYQWRHDSSEVVGATKATLSLTNVQVPDAGNYAVVVSNLAGTATSQPAVLDVDPAFTKITTGALVTDVGKWYGSAWADYDGDGYPDLFIHQAEPVIKDSIYHNNGDGTFSRLTTPIPQGLTPAMGSLGAAWGDYDQDGKLDLFLANGQGQNVLLRNRGNGTFQRVVSGPGTEGAFSGSASWGDYDRDGYQDLFVANGGILWQTAINYFYRNRGDGTFSKLTGSQVGSWLNESAPWEYGSWVDYDDDGWPDLMVAQPPVRLYRNLGNGRFVSITTNAIVAEALSGVQWYGFAWGDYDNDGRLDLFAGLDGTRANLLYHNQGAGVFKKMTAAEVGSLASDKGLMSGGVTWGDYDNDGFLDLFVANGWYSANGASRGQCFFYHNNGDGTFTRVTTGSPANELGEWLTAQWVDYDRDGFLDLHVGQHGSLSAAPSRLYHNNGNSNNWVCVKCVGTASPRDGTGAKVRAKATIRGKEVWQLRVINSGGTCLGGQSLMGHFGLGDATKVDVLRIEWTSGTVQELYNVPVKQYLTVTEPARLEMSQPGELNIQCWTGMACRVESSPDLSVWTPQATLTNLTGKLQWTDTNAPANNARFYRVVEH